MFAYNPNIMDRPIFIHAPLPRCGTNFLWDLLCLHPECAAGRSPIWEDNLLGSAGHLRAFADASVASWDPVWGPSDHLKEDLMHRLGDALVAFLTIDAGRRLVTKNPNQQNLEMFFDLFRDAQLLVLIRDGRAVAESGRKTFHWSLEWAARQWSKELTKLEALLAQHAYRADRFKVLRYEDLTNDTVATLKETLEFLNLNQEHFAFDAALDLPVRGSSSFRGGREEVHWGPVAKTPDFERRPSWEAWDVQTLAGFEDVAGEALQRWGYDLAAYARRR
jgi:hypothetical protein